MGTYSSDPGVFVKKIITTIITVTVKLAAEQIIYFSKNFPWNEQMRNDCFTMKTIDVRNNGITDPTGRKCWYRLGASNMIEIAE
jgi:hypothetical protein